MRLPSVKSLSHFALATLLVLGPAVFAAQGPRSAGPISFLTGPQTGEPLALAMSYIDQNLEALGLTEADMAEMVVKDHYMTRHNGTTHIYLKQVIDGIEVQNGDININVAADGSIINLGNNFVGDLAGRINTRSPALSDSQAIASAAGHFGITVDPQSLVVLLSSGGPALQATFDGTGLSREAVPVHLVYEKLENGNVRLAWRTVIDLVDSPDWWDMRIDAVTGEVISKNNYTAYDSYLVIPYPPFENPDDSKGQQLVMDPADPIASPFGWHDTDGAAGAEFTDTRGNNVEAHDDLNADNIPGMRVDGGAGLDFLETWDPAEGPQGGTNLEAAIVNLFYSNNVMHDLTYHYGFDEPAGNFQTNNYGNGGLGGDPVQADAQDGSGTNNANFATPQDGFDPRMQMFVWTGPLDSIATVNSPPSIAGDYLGSSALFGAPLTIPGLTDDVEEVNDGTGTTSDGCEPLIGFTPGNIALIDRGSCEFGTKVLNAENAGATGAIMVNDRPGILNMGAGADGGSVTISSMLVTQTDGEIIRAELLTGGSAEGGGGVNATLRADPNPPPDRDSDLDNGVIAHEYGHGISNRLTGGPSNSGCLFGNEQAGEGWSDFWTLLLSAKAGDTPEMTRGIGNYVEFQDASGPGIRNFPYTTDLKLNPQIYTDIITTNVPHGVGEIWMDMLWEVYWELVEKHGFDEDFYTGSGGNNILIQLVIDGMKLQPCGPDFVEARDAILMADMMNNGGENQCEIWRGFAKRGLGVNADAGTIGGGVDGGNGTGDEVADFTVPLICLTDIFADGFESGDATAWSNFP